MARIKVINLGVREYREVWGIQEKLLEEVKGQKLRGDHIPGYLLFVEHFPVYTLGKSGNEANMLINSIQLRTKHADFFKVDRGGDITFHGPGQWVVYPIFDLEYWGIGVKEYVARLEEIVISTLAYYGICGERLAGATGVWLDAHTPVARKICAIGVKCSRYVTMHGFALNVNTDLDYFNYIHPCGFVDKGVTSIQKELGTQVDMTDVQQRLTSQFVSVFEQELETVEIPI